VRESTISSVRSLCCSPVLAGALPVADSQELAAALKVLADPVRLRLLGLIRSAPRGRAVTRDLVASLDVSQPTISHHLGVLYDAGFVYRGTYEGPYCVACEEFKIPSELLEGNLCPIHGTPVEELSEDNYFFQLSKYAEPLLEHYRTHPDFVQPDFRLRWFHAQVRQGGGAVPPDGDHFRHH